MKTPLTVYGSLAIGVLSLTLHARNYEEKNGILSINAEDFASQALDDVRRWYVIGPEDDAPNVQDRDRNHSATTASGKYIEILPDTRATHADTLTSDINFSNFPGKMGVLSYNVYFNTPGEYIVWVRAFSTGAEDNGLHVGIDGTWPESGQRVQLCKGKRQWTWSSAQRVPENHCGYPKTIRIQVPSAGIHTIHLSMREDGFELDKFVMALNEDYEPEGFGPEPTYSPSVSYSELNRSFAGSFAPEFLSAVEDFDIAPVKGYHPFYVDKARGALAINAAKEAYREGFAAARHKFNGKPGMYALTLSSMRETDGESEYKVKVNGVEVLTTRNTPTQVDYAVTESHAPKNVALSPGDVIQVESNAPTNGLIPEGDGTAFARGRWTEIMLIHAGPIVEESADEKKRTRAVLIGYGKRIS